MKKEINLKFSVEEAKIIFDALSSHKYKIAKKRSSLSPIEGSQEDEKAEFIAQRLQAIENEIVKTDLIFNKIGEYVKEEQEDNNKIA
ncbi:MAG: hypothetical protein ACNS62_25235 [Candidatus Cyclobacteriaceae bacterium M3_2C_046]